MRKSTKIIHMMVLTSLFSALCFAGTFVAIPFGISKIHLGNFFAIIAGLLCGGIVGGLSGSIGMGLNDIMMAYEPDTFIRTFIVKFIMGFVVGTTFRYFIKKEKKVNKIYISLFCVFALVFITFLSLYLIYGNAINIGTKVFKNSILLIILLGLLSTLFALLIFINKKLKLVLQYVLLSTTIALITNIILEFSLKIPFKMLFLDFTFNQAFIYSLTSLPSAILTAIITIILAVSIYSPIYLTTKKTNKLNDLNKYINDEGEIKNEY